MRSLVFGIVLALGAGPPVVAQPTPTADAGRLDAAALAELRQAARQGPLDRQVGLKLARAELAEGRIEEAVRLYREVAERHESVRALLGLARIHAGVGDARGALDLLERARQLAPNSEEVLNAQARVALAAGASVTATRALEPLTRMLPSVMEYHYLLGVALMQAGDVPSGAIALEEARKLQPNRALTLIALGLSLNAQKLYGEAQPHLLRALEIESDSVEALAALAESEQGLGELEAAEVHARRVLAREEGHAIANLVMGLVRMKQQRFGEARASLERAIETDPSSTRALYQLSLACARLGDDEGQKKYLDLFKEGQEEKSERLRELRGAAGTSRGGM